MRTLVVTGGIATGKTTACQLIQQCLPGTVIFDCDASVHHLLTRRDIKDRLRREFGEGIFTPEDEIDRPRLGDMIFASADRRRILEAVLHPEVLDQCLEARERALETMEAPLFLADVPLFYEAHFPVQEDGVFLVAATRQKQMQRLRERGKVDSERAEQMMSAQMPIHEKMLKECRILWNEQDVAVLRKQVHYALLLEVESYGH